MRRFAILDIICNPSVDSFNGSILDIICNFSVGSFGPEYLGTG